MTSDRDLHSVARSLGWTLTGEVLFAAGHFGVMVVLAQLGSAAALGRYSLGIAIITPLLVLTNLHLRPAFVVGDRERFDYADYLSLRVFATPLACGFALGWSLIAGHDEATFGTIAAVTAVRASEVVADIFHAAAQRAEVMTRIGVSRAIRGIALVGIVALALAAGASPLVAIWWAALAGALQTITFDLVTARRFERVRLVWHPRRHRALVALAAPIGIAGGLLGFTNSAPTYVLEHVASLEVVGRFAAVGSILYLSGVINQALGAAAIPRLARLFEQDRRTYGRLLVRLVVVVTALNALGWLLCVVAGEWFLRIAYGPSFVDLTAELEITAVIAIVLGVTNLLSQAMVAMRRFRLQLGINGLAFVASVAFSSLFVPSQGLTGALWALGSVATCRLAIYVVVVACYRRGPTDQTDP